MKITNPRKTGLRVAITVLLSLHVTNQVLAAASAPESYIAHEWGTFTSVQGADGEQMEWNPFEVWDLPDFVYTQARPDGQTNQANRISLLLSKSTTLGRQRLETPVVYFYGDQPRSIQVEVDFPEGTLTEWYPQASAHRSQGVPTREGLPPSSKRDFLRWNQVEIQSPQTRAKDLAALLHDHSDNHYFAARATDANVISVPALGANGPTEEREGFLFYRGVGQFQAPLFTAISAAEDKLTLRNTGTKDLDGLLLLEIRQGQGRYMKMGELAAGKRKTWIMPTSPFQPVDVMQDRPVEYLEAKLIEAGLYEKEAAAMIETWKDSWFTEDGVRVLELLPRAWTDETLPLKMNPAPKELVRVMVGRAEILTPSMEWEFLKQTVRFSEGETDQDKARAVRSVVEMGLGRFAQPLTQRVLGNHPKPHFQQAAMELVRQASASKANPPVQFQTLLP